MKNNMSKRFRVSGVFLAFVYIILTGLFLPSCETEPVLWVPKSTQLVIGDYIKQYPEKYSEFDKIIKQGGVSGLINVRGPYTMFLPTNEAMRAYYKEKGVDETEGFPAVIATDSAFLKQLVYNHLIVGQIGTNDIGLGAIREPNAIGDFIATEFQGSEIFLNKSSMITKRDIQAANGYIHEINKVLDIIDYSVFEAVANNPGLSIFAEALSLTGIKDTLSLIGFPYGQKYARTRFTILAVPDTLYNRMGINNVQDLINLYAAPDENSPDDLKKINNGFYRYIEYHCMNGTYYLSDLTTSLYPILSVDNHILITVDDDYKLNFNTSTDEYTGFYVNQSNTPSKNGALHIINDLFPVFTPPTVTITMETTDFFDMKNSDTYGKSYNTFYDGEKSFEKIKWKGDFLQYYYKETQPENIDYDCLVMRGWWEISITFPKIPKGKYTVSIFQPGWTSVTDCAAYIDGEATKYLYSGPMGSGKGGLQQIAEVDFKTTAEHTVTLRNTAHGALYWDYIRFEPIR